MTSQLLSSLAGISDDHLVAEVKRLVRCERDVTAQLIAHLAEFDARRLYLGAGFASLFAYDPARRHRSQRAAGRRDR